MEKRQFKIKDKIMELEKVLVNIEGKLNQLCKHLDCFLDPGVSVFDGIERNKKNWWDEILLENAKQNRGDGVEK